ASWTEWNIALEDFNNIPQAPTRMYIGFGDRDSHPSEGGKGTVYFDDIRVYVPRCLYPAPVDYDGDCKIGIKDLGAFVGGWLDYGMVP
ncbi:MAG: hypothetical protein JXB29_09680, partial [Sedimentisphaerales bacterium]|nr:hypothetical protein [Sedimentisphaerales bacterium]